MDRFSGTNSIDLGGGHNGFRDRNLSSGLVGSIVNAAWLNGMQEEVMHVITTAGETPNASDWTQLYQAIQALIAAHARGGWAASSTATFIPVAGTLNLITQTFTPSLNGKLIVESIINVSIQQPAGCANEVIVNGTVLSTDNTLGSMVNKWVLDVTAGTALTIRSGYLPNAGGATFNSVSQTLVSQFDPT